MGHRFFSHPIDIPADDAIVPYINRPADDFEPAFFGQRITSLVPYRDGLYVFTSNLNSWKAGEKQSFLTESEEREYGAVYRIYRPGCVTVQSRLSKPLKFVGRRYRSEKSGRDIRELILYEGDRAIAVSRAYADASGLEGFVVE